MDGDEDVLVISIDALMANFRDSLVAMMPLADRAMISYADEEMHHDWEKLTGCLFDVFVRGPIGSDRGRSRDEYPLARYDIDLDDYGECGWIDVGSGRSAPAPLVRFLSLEKPFDTVEIATVDEGLRVLIRTTVPWGELSFSFRRRLRGGRSVTVHEIAADD